MNIPKDYILLLISSFFLILSIINFVFYLEKENRDLKSSPFIWLSIAFFFLSFEKFFEIFLLKEENIHYFQITSINIILIGFYLSITKFINSIITKKSPLKIIILSTLPLIFLVFSFSNLPLNYLFLIIKYYLTVLLGLLIVFLMLYPKINTELDKNQFKYFINSLFVILFLLPLGFEEDFNLYNIPFDNLEFLTILIALIFFIRNIWLFYNDFNGLNNKNIIKKLKLSLIFYFIIISVGFHLSNRIEMEFISKFRERLVFTTSALSNTIDTKMFEDLSWTMADLNNPQYQKLSQILAKYVKSSAYKSIYTMKKIDEKIVFGPESLDKSDPLASLPGVDYQKPPQELVLAFDNPKTFTIGPYTDEYGTFISAFSPVYESNTKNLMFFLGFDIEKKKFDKILYREKIILLSLIFIILMILFLGFNFICIRLYFPKINNWLIVKKIEVVMVLIIGYIFSITFSFYIMKNRQDLLTNLAFKSSYLYFNIINNSLKINKEFINNISSLKDNIIFINTINKLTNNYQILNESFKLELLQDNGIRQLVEYDGNMIDIHYKVVFEYPIIMRDDIFIFSVITPSTFNFHKNDTWKIIMFLGFLLSTILAYFINIIINHKNNLEHEVNRKTKEISDAYRELAEYSKNLRQFQKAIEESPASIVITDKEGRISYVNKGFVETTGYLKEEAIGQNPKVLKSDKHDANFYKKMWETLSSGEQWRGEICNKKKNGELYWEYAIISPLLNENNEIENYIAIKTDITETKKTQEAINSLNDNLIKSTQLAHELAVKAEQANKAKSLFLANMSHEIRTPMNSIMGFSYLLSNTDLSSKQREYLDKINNASNLLLNVINDILDFSKIEAGELKIENIDFNLLKAIEDVKNLLYPRISEKKLKFTLNISTDIPTCIQSDPYRLQQILINLIGNAIKFTEKGGITLEVKVLNDENLNKKLLFSIIDTGIGMTPEQLDNLFKPFSQADVSITRKYGGTGLGLAITKKLVELLGGNIYVNSEYGMGTTFSFEIPLKVSDNQINPQSEKNISQNKIENKINSINLDEFKILVVEDIKVNQILIMNILESSGAKVDVANNGKEALEILKQNKYDLIFMDIHMPEMDGIEATKRIREIEELKNIPIIALTADVISENINYYLQIGINDYVSKPIEPNYFFKVIKKWINKESEIKNLNEIKNQENKKEEEKFYINTYNVKIDSKDEIIKILNSFIEIINTKKPKLIKEKLKDIIKLNINDNIEIEAIKKLIEQYQYDEAINLIKSIREKYERTI